MKKFLAAILFILILSTCASALDLSDITDAAGLTSGPTEKVRLGIMNFTSKTYGVPDAMAAGISDFFARLLFKADDIMLVERERLQDIASELKLGMSGLVDPKSAAQIGKIAGAEYMLLGSITNLGHAQSGGAIPLPWVSLSTSQEKVKADLDIRVVDVETGEIVCAEAASGYASKSSTGVAAAWFGVQNSEFDGIEGDAIFNAAALIAPKIQQALTGRDTLKLALAEEFKKATKGIGKKASTASSEEKEKKTTSTKRRKTQKEKAAEAVAAAETAAEVASKIPAKAPAESTEAAESAQVSTEAEEAVSTASTAEKIEAEPEAKTAAVSSSKERAYENNSTDPAKVIPTYDLPSGRKNTLRIQHLNIRKIGMKKKAYDEYTKLCEEFSGDYLAAYKAGEVAQALRDKENAGYWYDKALEVNPDYEPAKKAKDKLNAASTSTARRKRK